MTNQNYFSEYHKMYESSERKKRPCLVPICSGERFDLVHKFPMEKSRALVWLQALDVPGLDLIPLDKIRNSLFVCSRHFRNEDYKNILSRHLNKTAIPNINLKALDQMDLVLNRTCEQSKHLLGETLKTQNMQQEIPVKEKINDVPIILKRKLPCTEPEDNIQLETNLLYKRTHINKDDQKVNGDSTSSTVEATSKLVDNIIIFTEKKLDENNLKVEYSTNKSINNEEDKIDYRGENLETSKSDDDSFDRLNNILQINHEDFPTNLSLDNFWLRDHCHCKKCYNSEKLQRKYSIFDIPFNVKPLKTQIRNHILYVKWNDQHESEYDLKFLYESQYEYLLKDNYPCKHILWDKITMSKLNSGCVSFSKFLTDNETAKTAVQSLVEYGFVFIQGVPANLVMTETVVKRLFPIKKSSFGKIWSTNKKSNIAVYHDENVDIHTDNTFFDEPAGLKILHCIDQESSYGKTILVDGFNILKHFKIKHSDGYKRLAEVNFPTEYITNEKHYLSSTPIIKLNNITNNPEQIRFSLYDRSLFNTIPQTEMFYFYKDLHALNCEINSDQNQYQFYLNPETVLIFDNWRILHGYEKFAERQEMLGCYVSRSDFTSVARSMGLMN